MRVLKTLIELGPTFIFLPFAIVLYIIPDHKEIALYLFVSNIGAFIGQLDFGNSQKALFVRGSEAVLDSSLKKIVGLQFIVVSIGLYLNQEFNIIGYLQFNISNALLVGALSTFNSFTTRLRIFIDLYCRPGPTLSVFRGVPMTLRLAGAVSACYWALSDMNVILLVSVFIEGMIFFILLWFAKTRRERSTAFESRLPEGQQALHWVSSVLMSSADLAIRSFLIEAGQFRGFIIFDIVSRLLFILNIFGTYVIRVFSASQSGDFGSKNVFRAAAGGLFGVLLAGFYFSNEIVSIYFGGLTAISIFSIIYLARGLIVELSIIKVLFVTLILLAIINK
jgi:hypothetical protein